MKRLLLTLACLNAAFWSGMILASVWFATIDPGESVVALFLASIVGLALALAIVAGARPPRRRI